ncbi:hypothetical protein ACFORG_09805 [Lutimaribacter marinistellae]|uniref:Pilus assembly protein n=1 Tax=Lutimaribacter marinistellae TaxID=1820329 RepID=A0ABV7TEM1_9RHOB
MKERSKRFVADEGGAVTVDWVVLTAAVVGLAGIAWDALSGPTGNVASGVSNYLETKEVTD